MKCLQEDESSLDDYISPEPAEQPAQEAERNDLELDDDLNVLARGHQPYSRARMTRATLARPATVFGAKMARATLARK